MNYINDLMRNHEMSNLSLSNDTDEPQTGGVNNMNNIPHAGCLPIYICKDVTTKPREYIKTSTNNPVDITTIMNIRRKKTT